MKRILVSGNPVDGFSFNSAGQPGNNEGEIENRRSTLAEKAAFGVAHPNQIIDIVRHGANTSGDTFGAVRPNSADSTVQATRARIALHPIAMKWNTSSNKTQGGYQQALTDLSKVYGPQEAAAVLSRP